ncbi:MAG TPA: response regulator [Chloroflexia bacterium]|nr:response regulator [Chloroflexia bacterium]
MVINDTQEILQLFEEILSTEGYAVSLHSYTTRELELVRKVKPDLIISDHPPTAEKQAWQFLQKMKMSSDLANIPLILCTTSVKTAMEMEGHLASKGVLIVPKPFEIDELLEAVNHQIGGPHEFEEVADEELAENSESQTK